MYTNLKLGDEVGVMLDDDGLRRDDDRHLVDSIDMPEDPLD